MLVSRIASEGGADVSSGREETEGVGSGADSALFSEREQPAAKTASKSTVMDSSKNFFIQYLQSGRQILSRNFIK